MNIKNEIYKKNLIAKTLDEKTNHKILFVIGCFAVYGFFDEDVNSIPEMFSQHEIFWYYYCSIGTFIFICLLFFNYFFSKKNKKILHLNTEAEDYFQQKTKLQKTNENLKDKIYFNIFSNALLLSLIFSPIIYSFHDQIFQIYNAAKKCSYLYPDIYYRPNLLTKCIKVFIYK